MTKVALLIGVSEYRQGLDSLLAATKDVAALGEVLQNQEMGGFDEVKTLLEPEPQVMQHEIENLFTGRMRDDLVLLYFSGHGIKDGGGKLYFATPITYKNSRGELMRSSAVPAQFIHEVMHNCRAKRQVIILDCCFSGAFDPSLLAKDDGCVDLQNQLGAEGRVVLASSSSTQYSFGQLNTELSDLSVYTHYLVEGIETGAGDLNKDGLISAVELHNYVSSKVQTTTPHMNPKLITLKELGFEVILSRSKFSDSRLSSLPSTVDLSVVEALFNQGLKRYIAGEQLNEITEFDEVFRMQPNSAYVHAIRGFEKLDLEDKQGAIEECSIAIRLKPDFAEAYRTRGRAKDGLRNFEDAITDFNSAIRLNPDFARAYYNRGTTKARLENLEGALEDLNEAIRLKSDSPEFYVIRGVAKSHSNDIEGALEDYNSAICLTPDNASLYFLYLARARAKSRLGDNLGAEEDCNEAIRLNPDNAHSYFERGNARFALENCKDAIVDYSEAIRLDPDFTDAYYRRGNAKSNLKDYRGAISDYTVAIRLKPDFADAYDQRGISKYELDDEQGAIEDFTETIQLAPNFADAYYRRGWAKSDLGDYQSAVEDFTEAIRLAPNFADAYYRRGNIQRILEKYADAIADLDEVIRLRPNDAFVYNHRGLAKVKCAEFKLEELGFTCFDEAIADFTEAIRLKPNFAEAYYNRGVTYGKEHERCRDNPLGRSLGTPYPDDDISEAIRLNPNFADAYCYRGMVRFQRMSQNMSWYLERTSNFYEFNKEYCKSIIDDCQKAAKLFEQQGDVEGHQRAIDQIAAIETAIEELAEFSTFIKSEGWDAEQRKFVKKEQKGFWSKLFS